MLVCVCDLFVNCSVLLYGLCLVWALFGCVFVFVCVFCLNSVWSGCDLLCDVAWLGLLARCRCLFLFVWVRVWFVMYMYIYI